MVVCRDVWWFVVVCSSLWWFAVVCGGLSFSDSVSSNLAPAQALLSADLY